MAKSAFTISDLCTIIRECSISGVSELKFNSLHVVFGRTTATVPEQIKPTTAIVEEQKTIQEKEFIRDEVALRQEQVAMMRIEDPSRAEEMLMEDMLQDNSGLDELED